MLELAKSVGIPVVKAKLSAATGGHTHPRAEEFAVRMCSAFVQALGLWKSLATMKDIKITGATAVGLRGCVHGPRIGGTLLASSFARDEDERKLSAAIAGTVESAWQNYTDSIQVPGLPWYPSFAMFPGPQAPPTPNIPCKLIELPQSDVLLSPVLLGPITFLRVVGVTGALAFIDAILSAFYFMFITWRVSLQVTNVMGTGPVPSYVPPVMRAGPVMGEGNMQPGGFV